MNSINRSYNFAIEKLANNKLYPSWMSIQSFLLHCRLVIDDAIILSKGKHRKEISIAAWLHDLERIKSGEDHVKYSLVFADELFKKTRLSAKSKRIILDCIKNHGSSGKPKTIIGVYIQAADKLSMFHEQVLLEHAYRFAKESNSIQELAQKLNDKYNKSLIKLKHVKCRKAIGLAKKRMEYLKKIYSTWLNKE